MLPVDNKGLYPQRSFENAFCLSAQAGNGAMLSSKQSI
jgi:hypothetical protein